VHRGKYKEMPSYPVMAVPSNGRDVEAVEHGKLVKDQLVEHNEVLGLRHHYSQAARKLARPMCKAYILCWDVLTKNTNIYEKWMAVFAFLQTKDVKPHLLQGFTGAEYAGISKPKDYMWDFVTKADRGEHENICTMTVQYGLVQTPVRDNMYQGTARREITVTVQMPSKFYTKQEQ
jgi:hypothetical protein